MSVDHALVTLLMAKLANNMLVLPTLPEIAVRVRQVAEDPDVNLHAMAEVISRDPALTARMIKVANSAFIGRSIKVSTLNQAVTRIGLSQVKNIATAMALEQLFVSQTPEVAQRLVSLWQETVDITCTAMACLQYYLPMHKHENLNIDTLTLASLVHRIGVLPILAEAEKHVQVFGEPVYLQHAIDDFTAPVGVAVLQNWDFADVFVDVVRDCQQPKATDKIGYTDFIRLGLISRHYYRDRREEDKLIDHYLQLGMIPQRDFCKHGDIVKGINEAKALFM